MNKIAAMAAGLVLAAGSAMAADEITINVYLNVKNNAYESTKQVAGMKATQATVAMDGSVMNVTSATNQIGLTHLTSGGYTWFRNVGTTGTVYVANGGSSAAFMELGTGAVSLVFLATTNMQAWTTSAAVTGKLDVVAHER